MKTKQEGKSLVVYPEGRLDIVTSAQLEDELASIIEKGQYHLILNLQGVDYMSSSGFRVCIATLRKVNAREGTLKICSIQPNVNRIFEVIELNSLFDVYPNEESALKE